MRLPSALIKQASKISPLLPPLLGPNKTIEAAQQELRWIQKELPKHQWSNAVNQRSQHVPLQYILGTQPFGGLDISVKPGVLIPRWETEEWTQKVSEVINKNHHHKLSILDICTGSGCIPLLLRSTLSNPQHRIKGIDISPIALEVAKNNAKYHELPVEFEYADIFTYSSGKVDLITSNPPYIPREDYESDETERSVRQYEPEIALVGDLEFYSALVNTVTESQAEDFIFELGYPKQADYVRHLLPSDWTVGTWNDSAGKLRCVVGTRSTEKLNLVEICDSIL